MLSVEAFQVSDMELEEVAEAITFVGVVGAVMSAPPPLLLLLDELEELDELEDELDEPTDMIMSCVTDIPLTTETVPA